MDTKPLKDNAFWIVCGVLLIAELVVMYLWEPTLVADPTLTPSAAADKANTDYESRIDRGLLPKADRTLKVSGNLIAPAIRRDDKKAVEDLLDKYIVTNRWAQTFDDVIKGHDQLLAGVQKDLVERSQPLYQEVTTDHDATLWHRAYLKASAGLIKKLIDAKALRLPATSGAAEVTVKQMEEDGQVRSVLDFLTTTEIPKPDQHRTLTAKLRTVGVIAEVLAICQPKIQSNANLREWKTKEALQEEARARIISLKFDEGRAGTVPAPPEYGRELRLSLTLEGTSSALMTALAAIDAINSPVLVRLGADWTRTRTREGMQVGRPGINDEPMQVASTIVVLDFAETLGALVAKGGQP